MSSEEDKSRIQDPERQIIEKWLDGLRGLGVGPATLEPYLWVSSVEVYVRDQTLSRQFYLDTLGFKLLFDSDESLEEGAHRLRETGQRWVAIAPMVSASHMFMGAALILTKPVKGSEQARRIGARIGISFLTEDIAAKYKEWSERGVHFEQAPTPVPWGIQGVFADLDGNRLDCRRAGLAVVFLPPVRGPALRGPSRFL